MICHTVADVRDEAQLSLALNSVIAAKQTGLETILSPLIARACLSVMPPAPKKASLNVDNVRVCKLIGGSIADSTVIKGVVVLRTSEGTVHKAVNAKVAVFGCGIEAGSTETKGTVRVACGRDLAGCGM
jgi:T-complex protein 1 subunit theta